MTQSARAFHKPGTFEMPDELEFIPGEVKVFKEVTIKFHAE